MAFDYDDYFLVGMVAMQYFMPVIWVMVLPCPLLVKEPPAPPMEAPLGLL